jgi:iron complex outermembrane receptor protein
MQQNRYNNEFGEDATPAFAVYAIRLQREVRSHGLLVACGIENILDKHYHAHLDWGNIPRPGRNFYLNFSYRF